MRFIRAESKVYFPIVGANCVRPHFYCRDRRPRLSDYGFKKKQVIEFKEDNFVLYYTNNLLS